MVARMMRWRPWPPLQAKKFEARLVVRRLEGSPEIPPAAAEGGRRLAAEVRWKGPKKALASLRRTVRRDRTREEEAKEGGMVEWNEEFSGVCTLISHKDGAFHPWKIVLAVFMGMDQQPKHRTSIVGMASLDLAEYASSCEEKEMEINVPLQLPGVTTESHPMLHVALSLLELRTSQESTATVQGCMTPVLFSPPSGDVVSPEKDELSALKAGLRKVKIITEIVSTRKLKKACLDEEGSEGKSSSKSDDSEHTYPLGMDSLDDDLSEDLQDNNEDSSFRKSFSYGTLASINYVRASFYSHMMMKGEYEDCVYYSYRRSDVCYPHVDETTSSLPEQPLSQASRSILPWRKRKVSFRSPKDKGEPLLKKSYGEEGGDDIDFDRRQLRCSDESVSIWRHKMCEESTHSSVSDFGDDNFAVGSWEPKEFVSRDGRMKLLTQVFFASIDQRSERAAGESACTALVAVIADWFQANQDMMPIKSQFDSLIREGSLEWRSLCENPTYRERFPDKHFDLETVLQAKIRPLSVAPGKSFIGFFRPEGTDDSSGFDFLHGAMSFDSIWDEISRTGTDSPAEGSPRLYIVSWNDHFFILKVECDACYIIDTLGERLHEGCNQAYILKFDESTSIHRILSEDKAAVAKMPNVEKKRVRSNMGKKKEKRVGVLEERNGSSEDELVCRGKECCKEFIKSFLAAIPIRELQADLKKGLMASTPIHHRLQIEFHFTELSKEEVAAVVPLAAEPAPEISWPVEPIPKISWCASELSQPVEPASELSQPAEASSDPSWPAEQATEFLLPAGPPASELSWPAVAAFNLMQVAKMEVEVA